MIGHRLAAALLLLAAIGACGTDPGTDPPPGEARIRATLVADGLTSPVYLTSPAGDPRLFIVEQAGRVRIHAGGALLTEPFLDIRDQVVSGGERGLLSIAFHPQYASNGYFFVSYTGANGTSHVDRFTVSEDPNRANAESGERVLTVLQPFSNHNGGLVKFGPDGMLYVGLGDGGNAGDPQGHGQNANTLLGALLRLDVDRGLPYAVPGDNPFVGVAGTRDEIWATGLRNPWRFSFDFEAGMIYIADVGQNRMEEVNARPASEGGLNYGWNRMEGTLCYPASTTCSPDGFVLPVLEYRNPAMGCSVTGGYVYRGSAIPALRGHYFYGDYCRGAVRSFRLLSSGGVTEQREWSFPALSGISISSFGEDAGGELYVIAHQGRVYRLELE